MNEEPVNAPKGIDPMPVVNVLSVRGVEYAMMSLMLWFGAGALIVILNMLVMGQQNFESMSFPLSVLLVSLPVFAFFFLRLRKAELANPALRLEPSKRRFTQITQIVAFLVSFGYTVNVVAEAILASSGNTGFNLGKTLGGWAVTVAVAGGVLVYYWFDEHKTSRS